MKLEHDFVFDTLINGSLKFQVKDREKKRDESREGGTWCRLISILKIFKIDNSRNRFNNEHDINLFR